jgi:hypothetical protein
MFNRNDFLNWNRQAMSNNPEAKDCRTDSHNPMKQLKNLPEQSVDGIMKAAGVGLAAGGLLYLARKGRKRQKNSIERRAQDSNQLYGSGGNVDKVDRPWSGRSSRKAHKEREQRLKNES